MKPEMNKQLFLDDRLIESSRNVHRTLHRPHMTGEVLLRIDKPYEAGARLGLYASVLDDGGVTRVWYGVSSERLRHVSYAESDDGLNFTKPALGLHEMAGTRANNVVIPDPIAGGAVWIDPHADSQCKYRSFFKAYPGWPDAPRDTEFRHYASPDGLAWTRQTVEQIGDCDTQHVAFWDKACGRYVLYTRLWSRFDDKHLNFRSVRRLESDDLAHWDDQGIVWQARDADLAARTTHTGQPALDYYGAAVFKYPGGGDVYIGLAEAYWHWLERLEEERWGESGDPMHAVIERLRPAAMDVHLLYSGDGKRFRRLGTGAPFMGLGPAGRFDSRMVWAMPSPIPKSNVDHHGVVDPEAPGMLSGLSRAVIRMDGFASIDADATGGEFTTPPLCFDGSELRLGIQPGGFHSPVHQLDPSDRRVAQHDPRRTLGRSTNQATLRTAGCSTVRVPVRECVI